MKTFTSNLGQIESFLFFGGWRHENEKIESVVTLLPRELRAIAKPVAIQHKDFLKSSNEMIKTLENVKLKLLTGMKMFSSLRWHGP